MTVIIKDENVKVKLKDGEYHILILKNKIVKIVEADGRVVMSNE